MARTYRKLVKVGTCTGSNTEFYRYMNRKCRNKNRQNLHNLMANYDIENIDNYISYSKPIHDSWNEPTDGTHLISRKDKKYYTSEGSDNFWNRKFGKYLKPKNRKHYRVI